MTLIDKQEKLYLTSEFLYYTWYRKLYGGTWRLIKFGKDTPYIRMFSIWTKIDPKDILHKGHDKVIQTETYPETGVDTRFKIFKEFIKQVIFRK